MILKNGAWSPDNGDNARDLQILTERILTAKSCGCNQCTCCLTAEIFDYTVQGGIVSRCAGRATPKDK